MVPLSESDIVVPVGTVNAFSILSNPWSQFIWLIKVIFWCILQRLKLCWEILAYWGQWLRHSRSWAQRRDGPGSLQWAFNDWVKDYSKWGKKNAWDMERLEIRIQLGRRHSKLLEMAIRVHLVGVIKTHISCLSYDVLVTVMGPWLGSVLLSLSFKEKCSVGAHVVNNASWSTWKFRWS